MLSCLPGIASSVKRAATSATRSAPLAMTMNCTIVMMMNTTMPTTRLPPATKLPNASMMWPASPSSRISRVVATDSDNRNNVEISSTLGKLLNATGCGTYSAISSRTTPQAMFTATSTSITAVGNLSTIRAMIAMTPSASTMSP